MKFILLFTLLIVRTGGYAQQEVKDEFKYKVMYKLTYQPDSTNVESVTNESMALYIGDQFSRFSSHGKAAGDSIMATADRSRKDMGEFQRLRAMVPPTQFNYYIFKKVPAGKISYTESIAKDNLKYEEEQNLMEWEIEAETKEVAGYTSQKATTTFAGRNYTAWFTPEIPISDGPYKFSGLPGLILELYDDNRYYVFELTHFQKLEDPVPAAFIPKDYIAVSKKKFLEVKDNYDRDPIAAVEKAGITFGFKPGQREKMHREHLKELKKRNNPIELE